MRKTLITVTIALMLLSIVQLTLAATTTPEGPGTFNVQGSERRTAVGAQSVQGEAGNITTIVMDGETVTQTWFGVVGNVTGTITLDDGTNQTLYDWSVANPAGEVFATNSSSITWSSLDCYNLSNSFTGSYFTPAEFETSLGLGSGDDDGVDETFSDANPHDEFYVGGTQFASDTCPATATYNSSQQKDTSTFQEVLLYDGTDGDDDQPVIYTALLEDSAVNGFTGKDTDFQMLLGENGHAGDTSKSTFYFYVEIE